jgi:hypothetical protein
MKSISMLIFIFLHSPLVLALSPAQLNALVDFKKSETSKDPIEITYYSVEVIVVPIGKKMKTVVFLGEEGHFADFPIPKQIKEIISFFPIRLTENASSWSEIEHTVFFFDRNNQHSNGVRKSRRQENVEGEQFEINSILNYSQTQGLFISSQNEVLYNGKLAGVLNSDGIYWKQNALKEIVSNIAPQKLFPFISRLLPQTIASRQKIDRDFIGNYESDLRYGAGSVIDKHFIPQMSLGAEFGSGLKFSNLPNGRGWWTNNLPNKPPTLRDYLMAENLLAALNSFDTDTIMFLGATAHNKKIAKLLKDPRFAKYLKLAPDTVDESTEK